MRPNCAKFVQESCNRVQHFWVLKQVFLSYPVVNSAVTKQCSSILFFSSILNPIFRCNCGLDGPSMVGRRKCSSGIFWQTFLTWKNFSQPASPKTTSLDPFWHPTYFFPIMWNINNFQLTVNFTNFCKS